MSNAPKPHNLRQLLKHELVFGSTNNANDSYFQQINYHLVTKRCMLDILQHGNIQVQFLKAVTL